MTQSGDIFATVARIGDCRTPQEVGALLAAVLPVYGLKIYAIGGMPTESNPNPTGFIYQNWPDLWQRLYFERNYASVDPVPRAAMVCAMPLTIGELRAGKAGFVPGPETDEYFAEAARLAGGKGLIVPITGPHGYHGIAVFVGDAEEFSAEARASLHLLAIYAHDRLLNLFGQAASLLDHPLSPREVSVLRLARGGAGDEAIAGQLGITPRTVRFHFENARKKLAVKSRAEALVKAVGLHLLGA
jgi:DNA-binding CsgD family transcriptional regulator